MLFVLGLLVQGPQHPNVCYEVFVRSFYDSNGDGIGDLRGLTQKLDYITGLGADCVWLMPVAESPSYHGYDVTDYYKVEHDYGTNDDFTVFVTAAHQHKIRVLVDLVLNHTSSEHPWFQEALRDTTAPHRSWYRWSTTPANNWHKSHLVEVGNEVSNTPGTHAVLRDFGQYVRSIAPQSYTVGEVWDNTDVILTYYPDQLDAYFAFPISEALMAAVRTGKTGGLLPTVEQFQRAEPAWRWAPFQRNHDQTRTLTALGNDTAGARLAATILLTLPGVPFIYYGEEIGMTGDKPDERLRTPMQWTRTSAGFTSGKPWETPQPDSLVHNVADEDRAAGSLLKLYRWLIRLRAGDDALRDGDLTPVETGNESVLAYLRKAPSVEVLIVANLGTKPAAPFALPGRYTLRNLLHPGANRSSLPTLAPRQAYIFEITRRP